MEEVVLTNDDKTSMTSVRERVRPINDNHSIKEVVISVFLKNSIDLTEFTKIGLPDIFDKNRTVEEVKRLKIPFNEKGIDAEQTGSFESETVGTRFSVKENGRVVRLLQGINESNRTFISYHSLNYSRWNPFFEEYLTYIHAVASSLNDVNVQAFSLHYIDEFEWLENGKIEPRAMFNVNSKYLPNEFFNALNSSFQLITEKLFEDNTVYDRIEIKTDNSNKAIDISHNLVRVLNKETQLTDLIKSEEFEKILIWAHNQNKLFLKEVLHKEIVDLVNLT